MDRNASHLEVLSGAEWTGWSSAETLPTGQPFRPLLPGTESSILFAQPPQGDLLLVVSLGQEPSAKVAGNLQLFANGIALRIHQKKEHPLILLARVHRPAELPPSSLEIKFRAAACNHSQPLAKVVSATLLPLSASRFSRRWTSLPRAIRSLFTTTDRMGWDFADFPYSHFDGLGYLLEHAEARQAVVHGEYRSAYHYFQKKGRQLGHKLKLAINRLPLTGTLFDLLTYYGEEFSRLEQNSRTHFAQLSAESSMRKADSDILRSQLSAAEQSQQELACRLMAAEINANDALTLHLLREASRKADKHRRIAFIGTGTLWDNGMYAAAEFAWQKASGELSEEIDYVYLCASEEELAEASRRGINATAWQYEVALAEYLLGCCMIVCSTHFFSHPGNCLLQALLCGAYKLQVWHGYPAKAIGFSAAASVCRDIHAYAMHANEEFSTDGVTLPTPDDECRQAFAAAFPAATQFVTGDPRADQLFLPGNLQAVPDCLYSWYENNAGRLKLIFLPTFRDENNDILISHITEFLTGLFRNTSQIAIALKLHPVAEFLLGCNPLQQSHYDDRLLIMDSKNTNLYEALPLFDGLVTDFSSILFDYLVLQKPMFIWRPDQLQRAIVGRGNMARIEDSSYHIDSRKPDYRTMEQQLRDDPLRQKRQQLADELHFFKDGQSSKRVVSLIKQLVPEILSSLSAQRNEQRIGKDLLLKPDIVA